MNLFDTLAQVRLTCRMRRLSRHTEATYAGWIARFIPLHTSHAMTGASAVHAA